ncbi:MAG: hypothetical protein NT175_11070 [Bacteroidetes bacterium]|nr:hypothetical protein [Bacteroidota bacterium]
MGFAERQIEWYMLTLRVIAERISEERGLLLSADDIGKAIAETKGYSQNLQVFWYTLDNGLNIYEKLKDYPFNKKIGDIKLVGEDCIFPDNLPKNIYEAEIKAKGQVWEIHQDDKDKFPSNPHAHDYETGLKLDLSNGNLFRKRKWVDSINKKKLMVIRLNLNNS